MNDIRQYDKSVLVTRALYVPTESIYKTTEMKLNRKYRSALLGKWRNVGCVYR
jgi:hypothetical protein